MKLLKITLFLLLSLSLSSSCKKHDEAPVIPMVKDTYWQATSGTISATIMGIKTPPIAYTQEMMKAANLNMWFWLNANGNVFADSIMPTELADLIGTWSQTGDQISLTILSANPLNIPIKSTIATLSGDLLSIPFTIYQSGTSSIGTLICTKR